MKDSGIEWLGEIPEHWIVRRLKHIGSICYGIGEPPSYQTEGVPLIRATNIHNGRLFTEGLVFVNPAEIPEKRVVWLSTGDILVVRSGAYTGDSAIVPEGYGKCIAGFDMVVRSHGAIPRFLQYAFLSNYVKEGQIDLQRMRAAQPHLNAEELGACAFALSPSADEQKDIVDFLDRETSKVDILTAEAETAITLLRERRSALISAATTGKIDVRGLVTLPPLEAAV
jgi:type I restriction enzyme S subunit